MSVTAAWPLDRLVAAIARAGWDELAGRRGGAYRGILRALADLLPHGSATGLVTSPQLADAAGISERWARHILAGLEEAGLITWTRGTIIDGKPRPSLIRVNKRALADLVRRARRDGDARLAKRAAATAQRLRDTLRTRSLYRTTQGKQRNPAPRAELSPTLPLKREVTGEEQPPPPPVTRTLIGTTPPVGSRRAQLRAAIAARAAAEHAQQTPQPPTRSAP